MSRQTTWARCERASPAGHCGLIDGTDEFFTEVEVERWDAPLVHLSDRAALELYLRGRGLTQADRASAIEHIAVPLTLAKQGALIYGRKSRLALLTLARQRRQRD